MTLKKLWLCLAFLCHDVAAPAEDPEVRVRNNQLTIETDSPRPLLKVLDVLQRRFGWWIDYEDQTYDLRETTDMTSKEWLRLHPDDPSRALDPAHGRLRADLPVSLGTHGVDESKVLQDLVEQYNLQALPGLYHVEKTPSNRFHLVGVSRYAQGAARPLDRVISIRLPQQSALDRVEALAKACSSGKVSIIPATLPVNVMGQIVLKPLVTNDSCRTEFDRLLGALPTPAVLRLLADPGSQTFYLNVANAGLRPTN